MKKCKQGYIRKFNRCIKFKDIVLSIIFIIAFILDIIIPDPIPILDEIILGVLSYYFSRPIFKRKWINVN